LARTIGRERKFAENTNGNDSAIEMAENADFSEKSGPLSISHESTQVHLQQRLIILFESHFLDRV